MRASLGPEEAAAYALQKRQRTRAVLQLGTRARGLCPTLSEQLVNQLSQEDEKLRLEHGDVTMSVGESRMYIRRLDHVQLAMPSGGEPRARAFYGEALGIPEIPKPAHLAKRGGC